MLIIEPSGEWVDLLNEEDIYPHYKEGLFHGNTSGERSSYLFPLANRLRSNRELKLAAYIYGVAVGVARRSR